MPRLADLFYTAPVVSPRHLVRNFHRDGDPRQDHDRDEAIELHQKYRNRVRQGQVLVADAAVAYFDRCTPEKMLEDLTVLPTIKPLWQHYFVETVRPKERPGLPDRWGWYFEVASPEQFVPLLMSRGVKPHEDLAYGVVGQLATGGHVTDAKGKNTDWTLFPAITAMLQVGADGKLLGPVLGGFPFRVRYNEVPDPQGLMDHAEQLLQPILFAIALAHSRLAHLTPVRPPAPKRKGRHVPPSQREVRGDREYIRLDAEDMTSVLTLIGVATIAGLPAAFNTCQEYWTPIVKFAPEAVLAEPFAAQHDPGDRSRELILSGL